MLLKIFQKRKIKEEYKKFSWSSYCGTFRNITQSSTLQIERQYHDTLRIPFFEQTAGLQSGFTFGDITGKN